MPVIRELVHGEEGPKALRQGLDVKGSPPGWVAHCVLESSKRCWAFRANSQIPAARYGINAAMLMRYPFWGKTCFYS
ncbi:hypothetical protein DHEL01_v202875 [Diaporthe helianthi]|uniref:Uncharacterized protein n=1 Tax=Diaporthe helianthi TaxID=158607 RepID=A0A2P5I892_DIAHE|nr:hypothetical protein DHEL01_v202875 [Diaporthe helianthi]